MNSHKISKNYFYTVSQILITIEKTNIKRLHRMLLIKNIFVFSNKHVFNESISFCNIIVALHSSKMAICSYMAFHFCKHRVLTYPKIFSYGFRSYIKMVNLKFKNNATATHVFQLCDLWIEAYCTTQIISQVAARDR